MSDLYRAAERLMGMSGGDWTRHANPWSVYTRFTTLPLLALAIWSRAWIGGWAWGAVAVVVAWIWINPRAFPAPGRLDGWAGRGVLGERVFLTRRAEVPGHFRGWALGLSLASLAGVVVLGAGLWWLALDWVIGGLILAMGAKAWVFDRMVWLYDQWLQIHGKALGEV